MQMKNPPHPGLLVRNELEGLGVPVAEAAKALGVTRQALYNVINGKTGITPEMAIRLAKGIGGTAEAWSRMQLTYDLARLPEEEIKVTKLEPRQSASDLRPTSVSPAPQILLRRDFANVSNATASTMITPITICWM